MSKGKNPYLPEHHDYLDGYNESIKENFGKGSNDALSLQRKTYDALHSPIGTIFLDAMEKEILKNIAMFPLETKNTDMHLSCYKGKLELIVQMRSLVSAHIDFISSEK